MECDYVKKISGQAAVMFLFRISYLLTLLYLISETFKHNNSNIFPFILIFSGSILFSLLYTKDIASKYIVYNKLVDNLVLIVVVLLFAVLFIWF